MSANNTTDIEAIRAAERIYHEWDEALGRKDIDAALKLYAPDAVLEAAASGIATRILLRIGLSAASVRASGRRDVV